MWSNAKIKSLVQELKTAKDKISLYEYQINQLKYVSCRYEQILRDKLGNDDFYEIMRDVMHELIEKDAQMLLNEDDDLDEIMEDLI